MKITVWDPLVRIFHWSLAGLFLTNALLDDPETALHRQIGYAVLALVVFRLVWGFVGPRHARFADFPPDTAGALGQLRDMATGRRHAHVGHSPLGALMIYNLLATLLVVCGSGWLMTTDTYWGVKWVGELHELAVNWAEFSVILHITAVFLESLRLNVNLPASMISGTKTLPPETVAPELRKSE